MPLKKQSAPYTSSVTRAASGFDMSKKPHGKRKASDKVKAATKVTVKGY